MFFRPTFYATLLTAWCLGSLISPSVYGQLAPEENRTFRTLVPSGTVADLYYDSEGERIRVGTSASFSAPLKIVNSGVVEFYYLLPEIEPGEGEREEVALTIQFGEGGPFLLLLNASTQTLPSGMPKLSAKMINDSWTEHPIDSLMVLNLSRRSTAVKIADNLQQIQAGEKRIYPYPTEGRKTRVQVAVWDTEENEWVLRGNSPQVIYRGGRGSILLMDEQPTITRPNPEGLVIKNLVDTTPPPAAQPR